jgi:hypothetical protein
MSELEVPRVEGHVWLAAMSGHVSSTRYFDKCQVPDLCNAGWMTMAFLIVVALGSASGISARSESLGGPSRVNYPMHSIP